MAHITVRDVPHYYEWITQEPRSSASTKPVMLFIHGWAGSARYWEAIAQAMQANYDCLLYDLRGFGRSHPSPKVSEASLLSTYELETYSQDLLALLDALNLDQVYLQAHSTGSSIAALFMNRHSERVHKAVLVCNGVYEYDAKSFAQFHRFGRLVVEFRPPWLAAIPGLSHVFMARFLAQSVPTATKKAFLTDFLEADRQAALGTMLTAVSEQAARSMPQEFAQLAVPTLLISGQQDQIIPAAMGEKAAALNDQINFLVIPKTGHFPMLETPRIYLQAVEDFLSAVPEHPQVLMAKQD
jgi:pimeloyl-ACP methyl ester carboxylesterase